MQSRFQRVSNRILESVSRSHRYERKSLNYSFFKYFGKTIIAAVNDCDRQFFLETLLWSGGNLNHLLEFGSKEPSAVS